MATKTTLIIQFCLHIYTGNSHTSRIIVLFRIVHSKVGYSRSISTTISYSVRSRINTKSVTWIESSISTILLVICNLPRNGTIDSMCFFNIVREHTFHFQTFCNKVQFMTDNEVSLEVYFMSCLISHIGNLTQDILCILTITE